MRNKLLAMLKHKLQWVTLLLTLFVTGQYVKADIWGVWIKGDSPFSWSDGTRIDESAQNIYIDGGQSVTFWVTRSEGTYCANTTISSTANNVIYYKYNDNYQKTTLNTTYPGYYRFEVSGYSDLNPKLNIIFPDPVKIKGDWDSWTLHNMSYSSSSWSYTQTFSSTGTYNFVIKPQSGSDYRDKDFTRADNSQTLIQGSSDATIDVDIPGDYTFTWNSSTNVLTITYPPHPCYPSSDISSIVNGTDVMFYIDEDDYGFGMDGANSKTGVVYDNNNKCALATRIGDTSYGYVTMSSANVESTIKLTNNWSSWSGQNVAESQTPELARGSLYRGGSSDVGRKAATTVSVVPSSSSIQLGTSSINLSITGTSNNAKSVYDNLDLYALIYVDGTKDGCIALSTSAQTYTLATSSLSAGSHTVKTILTDGKIYYIGATTTLTVVSCSTHPVATTGTATGIGLQGATLPITISSSASGTCTPTKVGVKLYTSSTCDEEVSGYTFDEATWTTDQAYNIVVSGLSPGNTYYYRGYVKSSLGTNEDTSTSPVKSFRTTPCTAPNVTAISNNSQTKCKGVAASQMELTVEGGVTPYSYAWKQNGSKSTTGATGATGSSNLASYTPPTSTAGTMYYYCVVSSATPCSSSQFSPSSDSDYATIVTNEVPSLSVVPTGTVKNFTPVTITSSNVNINSWSSSPAANDQTVYFYDNAAKSVKFKATVARSSNQTYTITATTAANCSANTSVTVTKDTETCE